MSRNDRDLQAPLEPSSERPDPEDDAGAADRMDEGQDWPEMGGEA